MVSAGPLSPGRALLKRQTDPPEPEYFNEATSQEIIDHLFQECVMETVGSSLDLTMKTPGSPPTNALHVVIQLSPQTTLDQMGNDFEACMKDIKRHFGIYPSFEFPPELFKRIVAEQKEHPTDWLERVRRTDYRIPWEIARRSDTVSDSKVKDNEPPWSQLNNKVGRFINRVGGAQHDGPGTFKAVPVPVLGIPALPVLNPRGLSKWHIEPLGPERALSKRHSKANDAMASALADYDYTKCVLDGLLEEPDELEKYASDCSLKVNDRYGVFPSRPIVGGLERLITAEREAHPQDWLQRLRKQAGLPDSKPKDNNEPL
ncbi:MAG: hypothetical protein M1816_007384 [Peltula sp. TS41687]|nr:MAG: hypothetical protein M1816_007384 [Peltula sp. TS41687]